MDFSVVIPIYKCSKTLNELTERLIKTLIKLSNDFEIIYVNDASPENDWDIITELSTKEHRVKGINFSRNFGQHYAITAGLDYAKGDWVIVMDGDLQDQPEDIIKLFDETKNGYEIIFGIRESRKDIITKKLRAKLYFKLFDFIAGTHTDSRVNTFSICSRKVINYFLKMNEQTRSYTLFLNWLGFEKKYVPVQHKKRAQGTSGYSLIKLISLSIDYILIYSNKPLKIAVYVGFFTTLISFSSILVIIYKYLINDISILGWTSLIVSLGLFAGITFLFLGIIGIYIGKIYNETKKRPIYVVKNIVGL